MYLFDNELFAIECIAKYAMEGLDVKEGGVHDGHSDEFAHCPTPRPKGQRSRLPGDLGYYLTFFDHQKQGLLQSVDEGRKCYFNYKVKLYLDTWPPGCFELWDIYDKFNKATEEQKRKISEAMSGKTHTEAQNKAKSERMTGEKHPQYGRTGALNPRSKAIIVIKPDGTRLHFGSGHEAARDLKIPHSSLCKYLKHGNLLTQGLREGYQFFYAE